MGVKGLETGPEKQPSYTEGTKMHRKCRRQGEAGLRTQVTRAHTSTADPQRKKVREMTKRQKHKPEEAQTEDPEEDSSGVTGQRPCDPAALPKAGDTKPTH